MRAQLAGTLGRASGRRLLVVGTFRSGTNVLRATLESHYDVDVAFSTWDWKHGLPPTRIVGSRHFAPPVPVVLVSKDPVATNVSLHRFWRETRPELDPPEDLAEFVRSELIVHDNSFGGRGPRYSFRTPTDYWNQFHHAWCHWHGVADRLHLLRYEELAADPARSLEEIAQRFDLKRTSAGELTMPASRVAPASDRQAPAVSAERFEGAGTGPSDADVAFVWSQAHPGVAARLGYAAPRA